MKTHYAHMCYVGCQQKNLWDYNFEEQQKIYDPLGNFDRHTSLT